MLLAISIGAMVMVAIVLLALQAARVADQRRKAAHDTWLRERQASRGDVLARLDRLTAAKDQPRGPSV